MALAAADPDCQITEFLAGLVAQGGKFEALLFLDSTAKACVFLLHQYDMFSFSLVTANRIVVDPAYVIANPAVASHCQIQKRNFLLQWKDCHL